jgi:fructose-1-phosphate kinase PfkB-like protein
MAKILVVGLNPAWQQLFVLPSLKPGAVHRATDYAALASGKGMNAAKILAARGHAVSLLQVLAGENGQRVQAACERLGIRSLHVSVPGDTRVCATLMHAGETTEVIAPFVVTDPNISQELLGCVPQENFDALLVCGTLPSGIPESLYGALADRIAAPLTIWDSVAGLSADALARVTWLKVNAEEYRALAPLLTVADSDPALLITDGAAPATVRLPKTETVRSIRCHVPKLDAIVNPIGAGDTVTAMLADGLLRGLDARAAIASALAAAAASCLNRLPAVWDEADAARLEPQIRWEEIPEGQVVR